MKKRILIGLVLVLLVAATASLVWANAGGDPYADAVAVDGIANNTCVGGDCTGEAEDALGASDAVRPLFTGFASLGTEGYLILNFTDNICLVDDDPTTADVRVGEYWVPDGYEVSVGRIGNPLIGTVSSAGDGDYQDLDLSVLGVAWFNQIKIQDVLPEETGGNLGVDLDFVECLNSVDALPIDIDIKPGSDPNCFNNDGHGVIPVAMLGSADFDVTTINPTTVELAGLGVRFVGKKSPKYMAHYEDVSGPGGIPDGFLDLVIQIEDSDGTFQAGDTQATVTGELWDGTPIAGSDSICIVPPK